MERPRASERLERDSELAPVSHSDTHGGFLLPTPDSAKTRRPRARERCTLSACNMARKETQRSLFRLAVLSESPVSFPANCL